jgi:hypothetical protein
MLFIEHRLAGNIGIQGPLRFEKAGGSFFEMKN